MESKQSQQSHPPLDLGVTIIPAAEPEPSPAYVALWRRLLGPLPDDNGTPSVQEPSASREAGEAVHDDSR